MPYSYVTTIVTTEAGLRKIAANMANPVEHILYGGIVYAMKTLLFARITGYNLILFVGKIFKLSI